MNAPLTTRRVRGLQGHIIGDFFNVGRKQLARKTSGLLDGTSRAHQEQADIGGEDATNRPRQPLPPSPPYYLATRK